MKNISTVIILFSSMIMQAQIPPKATVDVSGEGTVKVVPDQVSITVRVESNGKNPKEVKQLNDQTVNEVFAFEGFWYSRKEYQVRVYQSYQKLRLQFQDLSICSQSIDTHFFGRSFQV